MHYILIFTLPKICAEVSLSITLKIQNNLRTAMLNFNSRLLCTEDDFKNRHSGTLRLNRFTCSECRRMKNEMKTNCSTNSFWNAFFIQQPAFTSWVHHFSFSLYFVSLQPWSMLRVHWISQQCWLENTKIPSLHSTRVKLNILH